MDFEKLNLWFDKFYKRNKSDLLIFEEKHGPVIYNVSTPEKLEEAALMQLKSYNYQGYYYSPGSPPKLDEYYSLNENNNNLPIDIKEQITTAIRIYKNSCERYKRHSQEYEWIKLALKEKNGKLAMQVLESRQDRQYEGYSFEKFANP